MARRKRLSVTFGIVLQKHRTAAGLSREALAASAGLHRTYVGLAERGLRNVTIDAGAAMAQAVGRTLSQLIRKAELRVRP